MSDDEEQHNERAHKVLLESIGNLSAAQHIRPATRNEAQDEQDEFRLVKTTNKKVLQAPNELQPKEGARAVDVHDLVQVLKTSKSHSGTSKVLKNVQATKKVLPRPLEKPVADRINRSVAYDNVRHKLKRWNAVVTKNRAAETQVFPLPPGETIFVDTSAHSRPVKPVCKSALMQEMEETEAKLRQLKKQRSGDNVNEEEQTQREQTLLKRKLTRDELVARRKELAYVKMRQSQASLKARLRNKIKSKKYHKLLKRQKIQTQIKQFELLQKTDPEAALERLNALERSRVQERASLRHKNTGTWAKNLQMRAKYDKDVRKDLAEQLQKSRELTQKQQDFEEDTEEQERAVEAGDNGAAQEDEAEVDPFNPWVRNTASARSASEAEQDNKSWRKYWLERNKHEKQLQEFRESPLDEEEPVGPLVEPKTEPKRKRTKRSKKKPIFENGWLVEDLPEESSLNIDDIFNEQETKLQEKLRKKLKRLTKEAKELKKKSLKRKAPKARAQRSTHSPSKDMEELSFKQSGPLRPIIDEELNAEDEAQTDIVDKDTEELQQSQKADAEADTIDPNKLASVRLQQDGRGLAEFNDDVDAEAMLDEETENQHLTISQAFQDDDVVADFAEEKQEDSKVKDAEVNLFMPGWGSWAGAGISQEVLEAREKRKQSRLLLKLAPEEKRSDANKQNVYINEKPSKELRNHLVADLPFPFTSVKDYEASIRAPIGRNFVTETAFRMLTRPSVMTRKGQVIEPMDESELVKPPRPLRHVVDRRIQAASKPRKKSGKKAIKTESSSPKKKATRKKK